MKQIYIHHLELSKTTTHLSGGEKSMIEFIEYLDKKGYKNILYSSETAKIAYPGLKNFQNLQYVVIGRYFWEKINPYLAYFLRFFQLLLAVRKFPKGENIIVMHEDFLPTTIFGLLLKIINPKAKGFLVFHLKSPRINRGFMGEFSDKKYPISPGIVRFWLEQNLSLIISRWINGVIAVNAYYEDYLKSKFKANKVYALSVFGGCEEKFEEEDLNRPKEFDLIFMGRFQQLKGLDDLLEIFEAIKKSRPSTSLAIIGGGYTNIEDGLKKYIKENKLEKHIQYFGYLTGKSKYDIMLKSRVFLLPSYFESYGLVRIEAASCGLPTVSYDIPTYKIFGKENLITAKIGDKKEFANQILKLLDDQEYYKRKRSEALSLSQRFSWEETANQLSEIIFNEKKHL